MSNSTQSTDFHFRVPAWRLSVGCLVTALTLGLVAGGDWAAARVALSQDAPVMAVACDRLHETVVFQFDDSGTLVAAPAADAFDIRRPDVALTCQVVLLASGASDPSATATSEESVPAGTVSVSVSGPAQVVESGAQEAILACGDPGAGFPCSGVADASTPELAAVSGTAALTLHLALTPGALLPKGGMPGGVTLVARYVAADGSVSTDATVSLDVAPPIYQMIASATPSTIGSVATESTLLSAEFHALDPSGCNPLNGGPFLVCDEVDGPLVSDTGIEPGTVTFTSSLGQFANGEQRIDAACGAPAAVVTAIVVPAAGAALSLPLTCTSVAVRLTPASQSGDAVVSVRYAGALTGAFATDATHVTITPQATTLVLGGGCKQVRLPSSLPPMSPVSLVVELVEPSMAVTGVWRRAPSTGDWEAGYLRDTDAPVQFDSVNPGDNVSICVDSVARFPLT